MLIRGMKQKNYKKMNDLIFIRLDGDNIGDKIELSLLENDWDTAQIIHNNVQTSIELLIRFIKGIPQSDLLMIGCDDILFSIKQESFNPVIIDELQNIFRKNSQFTLSIGVGDTVNSAIYNLRKAKLSGKNRVIN
jgi:hypothetical protein